MVTFVTIKSSFLSNQMVTHKNSWKWVKLTLGWLASDESVLIFDDTIIEKQGADEMKLFMSILNVVKKD